MGRRALTLLALNVPWLALLPIGNALVAVSLFACALAAAFHGYGRLLVREPTTAIQVGIALVIGIASLAMLAHVYLAQPLLIVGLALHTAVVARGFATSWFGVVRTPAPLAVVPIALLALVGVVTVLGAAADTGARPFDDDGNLLGALRELADTRTATRGGFLGLAGLVDALGDLRMVRVVDALGFVLAFAYVLRRADALWAMLLVIAGAALALPGFDPGPVWLAVGLATALLTADAPPTALGALAGGLIALRAVYAPLAIIGLVRARRLASVAVALVVALPSLTSGFHFSGARYWWACGVACAIALALTRKHLAACAMLLALALVVAVHDGQTATGRANWYRRTAQQLDGVGYLARTRFASPRDLDGILRDVPPDTRIALWVPEPERFDHARHRFTDIRTARVMAMRDRHRALANAKYLLYAPDGTFDDLAPRARISRDGLLLIPLGQ